MGTASSDRARLRTDLRELAKLAGSDSSPAPRAFESADSSGFVDLSAFSAADDSDMDGWVERELARAGGRAKGGAVLSPGSMAPVAMTSLLGEPEVIETAASARKRGWVYTGLGLVGVAAVAVLAVALARHAPPSSKSAPQTDLAAAALQPAPATRAAAPQDVPVAPAPVASPSAAPVAVTVSAPDPAPTSKKHPARGHGGSAAAAATPVAAATHPAPAKVTIPAAPKSGGGGDSLMDLMRASINSPKKVR
jgi:hypothetical protein